MDYFSSIARARGKKIYLALAGKLRLEFFHPSSSVHKTLLPCVSRVRIHSDITIKKVVIHTIYIFSLF